MSSMSLASSPHSSSAFSLSYELLHGFTENLLQILIHLHNSEAFTMSVKMIHRPYGLFGALWGYLQGSGLFTCMFLFLLVAE